MRIGTAIANEKTSVIVINKKIYELASIFKIENSKIAIEGRKRGEGKGRGRHT